MINKKYNVKKTTCKVTFEVPQELAEKELAVVGEFNNWNLEEGSMKLIKKDKKWKATLNLDAGKSYQFRYFGDKGWHNEETADETVYGPFFAENSVVTV
ncbi:MAG: isoamylase early set domain-containing protein [Bacteroidetes Order II. Incertae sedis bacterium]|nr:isoamylase early set domain-containing protein [Bacteroidetes Order II. bacterium]